MRNLWQDIRYAIRLARLNPGFTTVAILSLMLAIGANTVLFSIVYGVLLRPLPYKDPDRLARLVRSVNETDITMPEFQFWKEHSSVFDSVAASRGIGDRTLDVAGAVQVLNTVGITTDYFRTLGVSLAFGREFNSDETSTGGSDAVILTHALWQLAFRSDPSILGRTVVLGSMGHTVVGILPAGFWFPQTVDVFVPLRVTGNASDNGTNSQMIGRLKPGVGFRQAAEATTALRQQFRELGALPYPLQPDYAGLTPIPYTQWLTGNVRAVLLVMLGAVGVLLLVACSNLAGLLLARLSGRQREIAVRLALGSSRRRLVRQFLTENVLLSGGGTIAALFFASALLPSLLSLIPFQLPATAPITLDRPVLAFAVLIAVGTAALLSLAPCLVAAHLDIHDSLKAGARIAGPSATKQRVRSALVVFKGRAVGEFIDCRSPLEPESLQGHASGAWV
jgi:putative ABC transport system permease protein